MRYRSGKGIMRYRERLQHCWQLALLLLACINVYAQQKWETPQSGWLYVLDGAGFLGNTGQVILVDPASGLIHGAITAGYAPDFVLSPDRKTLYVTAGPTGVGQITAYDTTTGRPLVSTALPSRLMYTLWPTTSYLAISGDGRWLFVKTMRTVTPEIPNSDEYSIERFELGGSTITAAGRAQLPYCGQGHVLVIERGGWDVGVNCPLSKTLRLLRFGREGGSNDVLDISLDSRGVWYANDANTMLVVTSTKRLCRVALESGKPECRALKLAGERWIPLRGWLSYQDNLYVGTAPVNDHSGRATRIEVIDLTTKASLRSINTTRPYWNIAIDRGGSKLYVTNPKEESIWVIDPHGLTQRQIVLAGHQPTLIIPVP